MEERSLRRTVLVARFQMLTRRRSRNLVGEGCLWGAKRVLGVLGQHGKHVCSSMGLTEASHQVRLHM